ncbi:hypothetical protein ABTE19_20695, partial [Acinetobacter baumannii]
QCAVKQRPRVDASNKSSIQEMFEPLEATGIRRAFSIAIICVRVEEKEHRAGPFSAEASNPWTHCPFSPGIGFRRIRRRRRGPAENAQQAR